MQMTDSFICSASPWLHSQNETFIDESPLSCGPVFTSTYHLHGNPDGKTDFYGRNSNPTWRQLETVFQEMEGGKSLIFPSGMAAVSAVLMSLAKPGMSLLLPENGYHSVRTFAQTYLHPFGIKIEYMPIRAFNEVDMAAFDVVWCETPGNPELDLIDIAKLSEKVHATGGLVICDNTTMTALGQNCLSLGADIVVCADTKAVNGHSDCLLGHVSGHDLALMQNIETWRSLSGAIPGPMDAWMVYRGVQTIELRLQRMCQTAQSLAEYLETHACVTKIRYPGLQTDPDHLLAKRQMTLMGTLVSFCLETEQQVEHFLSALKITAEATSFGGTHSSAEQRYRWDHRMPKELIRFSVGCEPTQMVLEDVTQALDSLPA